MGVRLIVDPGLHFGILLQKQQSYVVHLARPVRRCVVFLVIRAGQEKYRSYVLYSAFMIFLTLKTGFDWSLSLVAPSTTRMLGAVLKAGDFL